MPALTVRPMQLPDIDHILAYLYQMPKADAERIGLDTAKLPPQDELRRFYESCCVFKAHAHKEFYSIWCVDGEAIGYTSIKRIIHGQSGDMHLHMWSAPSRGQGFGGILFCLSALDFYQRFALQAIICEPRAANPMPNRMLQKIGFPLVRTYVGASSPLSVACELNRYAITRERAEAYLKERGRTFV